MKGNTKSCITSHRCSDREICNRCSLDPIRLLLRVHSPPPYILHKAQSGGDGGGESLGRELMIIKPNAVNVVMVPAAVGSAAHITPTHSLTYCGTDCDMEINSDYCRRPPDHTYK